MTLGIVQNRLAARSLSKDYLHIIDHIKYTLTCSVAWLGLVVCHIFKMLAFLSYRVICRKKSFMARVYDLSQFFKNISLISPKQCVHALYPLFDCPTRLLRAGQSLIVKNNAHRSKFSCLCSSHTRTPGLFNKSRSSSSSGLKYTSMWLLGCFGPWMSTGIIINLRFMHN